VQLGVSDNEQGQRPLSCCGMELCVVSLWMKMQASGEFIQDRNSLLKEWQTLRHTLMLRKGEKIHGPLPNLNYSRHDVLYIQAQISYTIQSLTYRVCP
jgi:hypothetical protein